MKTPIDFGKDFLYRLFDQRDADACQKMLAGDLVWITPESMHHFLSEGAVLKFVRKQIKAETESRYVDLISIKSSPSADNIMTVAYEINLVSREEERPLYLRCSMVICRRNRQLEITFLHFSKKSERDSSEQLRDFIANLPCGVMILACLDGHREEAIFYNEYFAHRLRYKQEEFARAMAQNPFFMASEEDRERIQEEIAGARKNGGSITANLRFYRRDGNSFYYRMKGMPAYQADGGTVYYCVFQEITGFQMTTDRLQERLDRATEIVRLIPEAVCGIEYTPDAVLEIINSGFAAGAAGHSFADKEKKENTAADTAGHAEENTAGRAEGNLSAEEGDKDVKIYPGRRKSSPTAEKAASARSSAAIISGTGPRVFFTSKNIPSMFGVSNSVYMKNILLDPFYGLEITSITRERLLTSFIFNPDKTATQKAVSCGIFRVQRQDRADEKAIRVELMVRRVKEKDGSMRLYLFYFDREAMQQDLENRVDRAMKMGRAGQEQLRNDLRKAKENAARRQNELTETIREAEKKHAAEMTRIENSLSEEKKRGVLMSRQLEEARMAQKQIAEEREKVEENASRRIRNHEARAQRQIKEACSARDLLEEQLREAQERSRALEQQLQKEKSRRLLLEEKVRQLQEQKEDLRKEHIDSVFAAPVTISESIGAGILSSAGMQTSPPVISSSVKMTSATSGAMQPMAPLQHIGRDRAAQSVYTESRKGDWMTQSESLTVFSAMDPGRTAELQEEAAGRDIPGREEFSKSAVKDVPGREEFSKPAGKDVPGREEFSKPAGKGVLSREEFSPESFIRRIMISEDTVCSDKDITLRLYLDSRFPASVIGYASLLRKALCEIIENAISRARQGGYINVHCRADRPCGGFVNLYFRIDDNGSAIPENGMQTMFEADHTAGIGGTARPGLYAAQEAAALMGGSLDARSSSGATRFSLTVAVRV